MDVRGPRVGIIISGGNVGLPRYARFLADWSPCFRPVSMYPSMSNVHLIDHPGCSTS